MGRVAFWVLCSGVSAALAAAPHELDTSTLGAGTFVERGDTVHSSDAGAATAPSDSPDAGSPELAELEALPLPERIDALSRRRDEPVVAKALAALVRTAVKEHGADFEVLWRAAGYYAWMSEGSHDMPEKARYAREGWRLADLAARLRPDRVEGHFFGAFNIGTYSQAVGILRALTEGIEGQFLRRVDRALALNAHFRFGGPMLAKGRYHYELPWPKRDLKKSRLFLQRAVSSHPEALRGHLYLAQLLLREGDAAAAKKELAKVFAGSGDYDPPEARRVRAWAAPVREAIEKALR
jgi:hypothetical protein